LTFLASQVFAGEELERLRGFPEIGRDELFRFFTLTSADVAFVDPGRGCGPADRLGLAVALCTLPWLGVRAGQGVGGTAGGGDEVGRPVGCRPGRWHTLVELFGRSGRIIWPPRRVARGAISHRHSSQAMSVDPATHRCQS